MDYGRNRKIHGFLKRSHNCNAHAQDSNTCPRGLKLNASGETRKGFPLTLPLPCDMRGCEQQNLRVVTKTKPHPKGWGFVFGMPRAGLNSLPRPARSASNSEVRQGSCEWLCHSRDAGKRVRASSRACNFPHGERRAEK